jgi:hypothetical protein
MPYATVNDAYRQATGRSLPSGVAGVVQRSDNSIFRHRHVHQSCAPEDETCIPIRNLIDLAITLCGKEEKVYPADVRDKWPQAWIETQAPALWSFDLFLSGADGLPGVKILHMFGEFNSSLVCNKENGCVLLNSRKTQFLIGNVTTPPTYDQALFLFKEPAKGGARELCGVDTVLIGTGLYGNAPTPPFGSDEVIGTPIFNNVVNRNGLVTADTFGTSALANGVGGADAGVGSNYYIAYQTLNATSGTSDTHESIYSTFFFPDPASGRLLLWGFQHTHYSIPVPGLPI